MAKRFVKVLVLVLILTFILAACNGKQDTEEHKNRPNNYVPYSYVGNIEEGMEWPEGRILPKFSNPAEKLDTVRLGHFPTAVDKTMITAFQGLINAKKTRVFVMPINPGEGARTWPKELELELEMYDRQDKYEIIKKYQSEIEGVVLYDYKKSPHYLNLANTVSGLKRALPVTVELNEELKENGIDLPVVEDLTGLEYTTPIDIYNHLYEKYWPDCTKRLIVSVDPTQHVANIRDMAVATKSAVVWLDNRKDNEKEVMVKFFRDMKPGESIAIGWYTEERSGIGAGTENGIPTIPADWFDNTTVYAATDSRIQLPAVPKKPELENKVYIAIFLSDGDNVQYNQHVMKNLWRNKDRGTVPINWTISPGLIDFAPGILNSYYTTATENDFFASGPSGLGYTLIIDELNDFDINFTEQDHVDAFVKLSNKYLERSGLRVITIWDRVNTMQATSFAQHARYIYGNTFQDWGREEPENHALRIFDETTIVDNKMAFIPNSPCYAEKIEWIYDAWKEAIGKWDGNSPLFLSAQGKSWVMTPANIKQLSNQLEKLAPGKIEILRGDHFFSLFNEANGLPFNLSISEKVKVTASDSSNADVVLDGTPSGEIWSTEAEEKWLQFDLGGEYEITRYVIRHAGDNDPELDKSLNTKDYKIEYSMDGNEWKVADKYIGNEENVTDIDIDPVKARYVRLVIDNPGSDGKARIAEVELYGRVVK